MSRPDPSLPQRRAADPKNSVWVAASAGTGKTKVLTDRVLALLLAGTRPERLLCLTFTKAAAAEMANRVAAKLAGWTTSDEAALRRDLTPLLGAAPDDRQVIVARRLFARLLDSAGGMRIETIHGFCQSLLRRFPLEAGLAPHFQVMDDRDAGELMAEAREALLSDPAMAEALAIVTARSHEENFPELMRQWTAEAARLQQWLDAAGGDFDQALALWRQRLALAPGDDADNLTARLIAGIDRPLAAEMARHLLTGTVTDQDRATLIREFLADPSRFDLWRMAFLTDKGRIRKKLCTKGCDAAHPGLRDWLEAEADSVFGLAEKLRALAACEITSALARLALRLVALYRQQKQKRALLDYDDLILHTIALLRRDGGASWVLYKLDGGIDHLLIDEAQDTNPDQWAVIRALSAEFFTGEGARRAGQRTIFAVGDAKQSIYSFQRADPREFEASRRALAQLVPAAGGGWDEVALDVSFRSVPSVLQAVDLLLAGPGGAGVVAEGETVRHIAWRDGMAGSVELWAPVAPDPQDEDLPWKPPVEARQGDNPPARLARLIAGRIDQMIRQKEILASKGRPIAAGDILVLVRRRNQFVDHLVKALKRLDIPVAGADRMVLTEQLAVMDLMALAQSLLLPEDDLTLAVVLKGPLLGLSEEALFQLAFDRPGLLWQALSQSGEPICRAAHGWLAALMAKVDLWTPHELFSDILNRGGKRQLLARLGPEAEDPLDEFLSLCLAYEQGHPPSLQGFLHWLAEGGTEIKRDLDQGGGAIRIMTVHGAKGLQAPIVFLPDTLQKPRRKLAILWLDDRLPFWSARDDQVVEAEAAQAAIDAARDAEYRRLLYVAMTRAEDRLIICGWENRQKAPADCWYQLIHDALSGEAAEVMEPRLAALGHESKILLLAAEQRAEIKPAEGAQEAIATAPLPDWAMRPAPVEPTPPRPLAPSRPDLEPSLQVSPAGAREKPARQRGALIHNLLQILPAIEPDSRKQAAARFLGRSAWGLSYSEQAEIALEVARVMEEPEFAPIFAAGSRAELPLIGQLGARVISGRVDRLWVGPDQVLVVDFKTDRRPPDRPPAAYLRQMAAYRGLLACLYPRRTIRCALLWTDRPVWMNLDPAALDDALAAMSLT